MWVDEWVEDRLRMISGCLGRGVVCETGVRVLDSCQFTAFIFNFSKSFGIIHALSLFNLMAFVPALSEPEST